MALNIRWQTHYPNSESWNSGLANENSASEKKNIIFQTKSVLPSAQEATDVILARHAENNLWKMSYLVQVQLGSQKKARGGDTKRLSILESGRKL